MKKLLALALIVFTVGCGDSNIGNITSPSSVSTDTVATRNVTIPTGPNSCPDANYPVLTTNVNGSSVLFLWTPTPNVDVYDFEVERFGDFNEYVSQDQFRADPKGVQHGLFYTDWQVPTVESSHYRVRIRTKNRCDVPGPWSPWVTFVFDGKEVNRPGPPLPLPGTPGGPVISYYELGPNIAPFSMLAGAAITCTTSTITGDVGVSPGSSITGIPGLCVLNGLIRSIPNSVQAKQDLADAFNNFVAEPCIPIAALLTGVTLNPGVYCSAAASSNLTGTLTLSGAGRYVIRFPSTLITSPGSNVNLINGASCGGVNYVIGSSGTLAGNLVGNVIAFSSVTMNPGASVTGRLLARNAAVTITTSTVTNTNCN